jgi:hypothetical protein
MMGFAKAQAEAARMPTIVARKRHEHNLILT